MENELLNDAELGKLISDRVRTRRKELDMSQSELAKLCGYKNNHAISKIETRGNGLPAIRLPALAKALDCSIAYLLGLDTEERYSRHLSAELGYYDVQLLTKFDKLQPTSKEIVLNLIDELSKIGE